MPCAARRSSSASDFGLSDQNEVESSGYRDLEDQINTSYSVKQQQSNPFEHAKIAHEEKLASPDRL